MKIEKITGEACTACSACMNICPKQAISIIEDKFGFYEPVINHNACIECGLCDKTCPELHLIDNTPEYQAFCGFSTVKGVREKSSSGGLFRALADVIIASDGIVFGAAFNYGNPDLRLEHYSSEEVGLEPLQKSKYVQSYIGMTYKRVKETLLNRHPVMFVGTPCQVAGLNSFLGGKEYSNLLTVDFICHGVPSAKFLRDHLNHIGFQELNKISRIDFRPKIKTWVDDIIIESKRKKYKRFYRHDAYFKGFQSYLTLRKSCFDCSYCNGHNRQADITLADYWGFGKTDMRIEGWRKGLSLVLAYSEKGMEALKKIDNVVLRPVDILDAEYVYRKSRKKHYPLEARNAFISDYAAFGYEPAVAQNGLVTSLKELLSYKVKNLFKKFLKR